MYFFSFSFLFKIRNWQFFRLLFAFLSYYLPSWFLTFFHSPFTCCKTICCDKQTKHAWCGVEVSKNSNVKQKKVRHAQKCWTKIRNSKNLLVCIWLDEWKLLLFEVTKKLKEKQTNTQNQKIEYSSHKESHMECLITENV